MAHNIPSVFEGMVEIDETYPGAGGEINGKMFLSKELTEVEAQLNKLSLVSYVAMARYGLK